MAQIFIPSLCLPTRAPKIVTSFQFFGSFVFEINFVHSKATLNTDPVTKTQPCPHVFDLVYFTN